ncbi:hypothetical protein ILP74_06800 [Citrobacter amalonaticus]|uniref:hypothetical protein n=1 Tax=Citrobacter amalonaticus TaxID=35703 RepID=UPI0017887B88|nr:hypothetical protein [Citrobacter amalonaticus]MBE0395183.1 hypothetical protein [Citrobacter amalonaticus]
MVLIKQETRDVDSGTIEIEKTILRYILATPQAIGFLFFSWLSGHLWAYVVFTYFQNKKHAKGFFDSKLGKTALGILWFTLIGAPFYCLKNKRLTVDYNLLLDLTYSIVMVSLFIQAVIFIIITLKKRA